MVDRYLQQLGKASDLELRARRLLANAYQQSTDEQIRRSFRSVANNYNRQAARIRKDAARMVL